MTYKYALRISITIAFFFALYTVITGYLFPDLWRPSTTRFETWFDRVYFITFGIFYTVWRNKHDNP